MLPYGWCRYFTVHAGTGGMVAHVHGMCDGVGVCGGEATHSSGPSVAMPTNMLWLQRASNSAC